MIPFGNWIRKLRFLCRLTDIKIAWINPRVGMPLYNHSTRKSFYLLSTEILKISIAFLWKLLSVLITLTLVAQLVPNICIPTRAVVPTKKTFQHHLQGGRQKKLLILNEHERINFYSLWNLQRFSDDLIELIDFYSPWNHQKTIGFLMISGEIEVN